MTDRHSFVAAVSQPWLGMADRYCLTAAVWQPRLGMAESAGITETNRIQLVLFGIQNRTVSP
jgi:hypothetical protein